MEWYSVVFFPEKIIFGKNVPNCLSLEKNKPKHLLRDILLVPFGTKGKILVQELNWSWKIWLVVVCH
jgi:hypothetical protein